jgi:WD40 repeat protein
MDWRIDVRWLDEGPDTSLAVPGPTRLIAVASGEDRPAVIAMSPAFEKGPVVVVDAESGEIIDKPISFAGRATALDVVRHGDEILVAVGTSENCAVYRLGVPTPVMIETSSAPVSCVRFKRREGGPLAAVGYSGGQLEVYAIDEGGSVGELLWRNASPAPEAAISCMTFNNADYGPVLVTGSEDGTVALLAESSGRLLLRPLRRRGAVRNIHALPNGDLAIHDDAGLTAIRFALPGLG